MCVSLIVFVFCLLQCKLGSCIAGKPPDAGWVRFEVRKNSMLMVDWRKSGQWMDEKCASGCEWGGHSCLGSGVCTFLTGCHVQLIEHSDMALREVECAVSEAGGVMKLCITYHV